MKHVETNLPVHTQVIVDIPLCAVFCGMITKVHISRNKVTYDIQAIVSFDKDDKNKHKSTRIANVDAEFVVKDDDFNQWRLSRRVLLDIDEWRAGVRLKPNCKLRADGIDPQQSVEHNSEQNHKKSTLQECVEILRQNPNEFVPKDDIIRLLLISDDGFTE